MQCRQLIVVGIVLCSVLAANADRLKAAVVQMDSANPSETFFTVSASDLVNDGQPTLSAESDSGYAGNLVAGTPTVLNNGLLGGASDGSQGAGEEGGSFTVTYALDTALNPLGYNIERIETFSAWGADSRSGQSYLLEYNTVANPTFSSVGTFSLNNNGTDNLSSRIELTNDTLGPLSGGFGTMTGVSEIRFTLQSVGGLGQVYRELDLFGEAVAPPVAPVPEPSTAVLLLAGAAALGVATRRRRTV